MLENQKAILKTRRRSIKNTKTGIKIRIRSIRSTNIVIKTEAKTKTRREKKKKVCIMIPVLNMQRNIMKRSRICSACTFALWINIILSLELSWHYIANLFFKLVLSDIF